MNNKKIFKHKLDKYLPPTHNSETEHMTTSNSKANLINLILMIQTNQNKIVNKWISEMIFKR